MQRNEHSNRSISELGVINMALKQVKLVAKEQEAKAWELFRDHKPIPVRDRIYKKR